METYTKDGITIVALANRDSEGVRTYGCKDCFFKRRNDKNSCNEKKVYEWGVPDCVLEREVGCDVIYQKQ